jgi:hypothetical protein
VPTASAAPTGNRAKQDQCQGSEEPHSSTCSNMSRAPLGARLVISQFLFPQGAKALSRPGRRSG